MNPVRTLAIRTIADARIRTLSFAAFFVLVPVVLIVGYTSTYPTAADRLQFAQTFGDNKVTRLFYGTPYDLTTVAGYAAWRGGGVLVLFAAFFGLLAGVRAFRAEEETGRFELVAAGVITRPAAVLARIAAIAVLLVILWAALAGGFTAAGLASVGSAYLALAIISAAVVYAAVGVVASQIMSTSRDAMMVSLAVFAVDFAVRILADTADITALHWPMPLGWVEEAHAFTGPRPLVLLLPALLTLVMAAWGLALERNRDVGAGLLASSDVVRSPSMRFLGSPVLVALRGQAMSFAVWSAAITAFAVLIGTVSKTVSSGLSQDLVDQIKKLGLETLTPAGYIGLAFLFFVLAISLFCCSQLAALREDESEGRLETLFAHPQGRTRWLGGRLLLAAVAATCLAALAGLGAALGATAVGVRVSFPSLLGTGFNVLPATLLFLGLGAAFVAVAPRVGVGLTYALVVVAFIWELVGALLGAPSWLLGASPFHQTALVPAVDFRALPAAVMLALAFATSALAVVVFRNRDLIGA